MRHLLAVIAVCLVFAPEAVHAAAAPEQPAQGAISPRSDAAPAPQRRTPVSDRCTTQYTNCILFERQALGSSCWCITPFGPAYGRVVRGW